MSYLEITEDLEEKLEDLEEAARLDRTEVGEWWFALVSIKHTINYGASKHFINAWVEEIEEQHAHLKENFKIVETEQVKTIIIKSLEFIG